MVKHVIVAVLFTAVLLTACMGGIWWFATIVGAYALMCINECE